MSTSATPNPFSPDLSSRSPVVSRTHRVVRERARTMQARKSRNRALLVPLAVASALVMIIISAVWLMFDEYELPAIEFADSRFHLPILLIWFLPVTGALLIAALVRRLKFRTNIPANESESTR